jgi:ankyrin repeat protein
MSGDDLRQCSVFNQHDKLREHLLQRANPCSADEFGLTALHYAIWNGNIECVKLLIMNPNGITKEKVRRSCINLKSDMGYSPLHLLALECPSKVLREILFLLLLVGADLKDVDNERKSPIQIAKDNNNQLFLDSLQEFISLQKNSKEYLRNMFDTVRKKYSLHDPAVIEERENEKKAHKRPSDDESYFPPAGKSEDSSPLKHLPERIQYSIEMNDKSTKIQKPKDLLIHENLIPSLTNLSFMELNGLDSLKGLAFLKEEALKNIERREKLVQKSETTLPKIDVHQYYE